LPAAREPGSPPLLWPIAAAPQRGLCATFEDFDGIDPFFNINTQDNLAIAQKHMLGSHPMPFLIFTENTVWP